MKIAYVLDDTLDSTDGVQQYILSLGTYFRQRGHDVHYIVGQSDRTDIPNVHSSSKNIGVSFNKNRMSTPLPASRSRIERLFATHKFDVIHVQMPYSPFMASKVISTAKNTGTPVVATFHILPSSQFEKIGLTILSAVEKQSLRSIDRFLAVSEPAQSCLKDYFNVSADVLPNPVDTARYTPEREIKKLPGLVVFVGRLVERKGCRQLLHAVLWLKKHELLPTHARFVICGDGPQRKQLETFVRIHAIDDVVTFAGRVDETEKITKLQSAEIAVFPSTGGESFGIVLIEAMAAGAQVVLAGDNPGYRAVLKNNEQLLVDPHNTEVFAAQLRHYLIDKRARNTMQKWQKNHVEQYALSKVGKEISDVYQNVIAKKQQD
jgi:phosphatidyl-myo-inositol alpha-mannosyltransferase